MGKARTEFTTDLGKITEGMRTGAAHGILAAAEFLLGEANKDVPHDEGTLERSGEASADPQTLKGAVSYDTPYAPRQHEDMSLHHSGKGKAKWLENTFTREKATAGQIVANAIRREVDGGA